MIYLNYYCFVFYFLIILTIDVTIAQESCSTPAGKPGDCIIIHKCQPVLDILRSSHSITPTVIAELKSYHCGSVGANPKVCCHANAILATGSDVSNQTKINLLPTNCGELKSGDKIVNGETAGLFEFPWMAVVYHLKNNRKQFKCGATIINDRYILTAAHCLQTNNPIVVRIGEYNTQTDIDCEELKSGKICAPPFQDLDAEAVIPHPDYYKAATGNDIGLIRVKKMTFRDNVKPICLRTTSSRLNNIPYNKLIVTGWGLTENLTNSDKLLKVPIEIYPHDQCVVNYSKFKISEQHICAGGTDSKDSCKGDSGGPLQALEFIYQDVRYVQRGIVSFGPSKCASKGIPGIYTNVEFYMKWILDTIRP